MGSTHTPGTLRAIPSGVINRLLQNSTLEKPSLNSEGVDKIYPDHEKSIREVGLEPPILPTMGE